MKLKYTFGEIATILTGEKSGIEDPIVSISIDTRKLISGDSVLFFALEGQFRKGVDFIQNAYELGVRHFVVPNNYTPEYSDAMFLVVDDPLVSLKTLAKHHRDQFNIPIVVISGSYGKTTIKEWLSQILSTRFEVVKSPKSYNSKIGVSLSLLEIQTSSELAVIEVGIGEKGHMLEMNTLLRPTHGIRTKIGERKWRTFSSREDLVQEIDQLFLNIPSDQFSYYEEVGNKNSRENNLIPVKQIAKKIGLAVAEIESAIELLPQIAMRLESYEGIHGNKIINDTYRFSTETLRFALEHQLSFPDDKARKIILDVTELDVTEIEESKRIIEEFQPIEQFLISKENPEFEPPRNANILLTGKGKFILAIVQGLKKYHHQTYLEIDLNAIRKNIYFYKSKLKEETKLLCMLKASAYGSDAKRIGPFLEKIGVNYIGVAYPSEGVELRSAGVSLPVLVMNCDRNAFSTCIEHNLEPAIFDLDDLEEFISLLISKRIENYPIHIKVETGMNRLGIDFNRINQLLLLVKGQPEIYIKSIYSHLAESDVVNSPNIHLQLEKFKEITSKIIDSLPYSIDRHILNSNGILNYTSAQYEMVRLGIGIYGISGDTHLSPALKWMSSVSQVKTIQAGESVGYNRAFIASEETKIAVIPVGYADGFDRRLGNGKGGVFIKERFFPTVGNVCMDMIMVKVDETISKNDPVEIIGIHQTFSDFASKIDTIPYEVLTNFSNRIERIYTNL